MRGGGRGGAGSRRPCKAAAGIRKLWETKFEKRSPRYATRVSDLPQVA
ncbi:DUF4113 domain-containing protein [Microvirga vignae]